MYENTDLSIACSPNWEEVFRESDLDHKIWTIVIYEEFGQHLHEQCKNEKEDFRALHTLLFGSVDLAAKKGKRNNELNNGTLKQKTGKSRTEYWEWTQGVSK